MPKQFYFLFIKWIQVANTLWSQHIKKNMADNAYKYTKSKAIIYETKKNTDKNSKKYAMS